MNKEAFDLMLAEFKDLNEKTTTCSPLEIYSLKFFLSNSIIIMINLLFHNHKYLV